MDRKDNKKRPQVVSNWKRPPRKKKIDKLEKKTTIVAKSSRSLSTFSCVNRTFAPDEKIIDYQHFLHGRSAFIEQSK